MPGSAIFRSLVRLSWCTLLPALLPAQVVTTDPAFPHPDSVVSVYFYADMGNAGLEDYAGDVYAHTGVITDLSQSPSDWRYVKTDWGENTPETKLVRLEDNLYRLDIIPDISSYYSVDTSEEILQLAFVFRSGVTVGGNYLEGKTATGGDIFVDVYSSEEPTVIITAPTGRNAFLPLGDSLDISISSSDQADLRIFVGAMQVAAMNSSESLTFTFAPAQPGSWLVIAEAEFQPENLTLRDTLAVLMPELPTEAPLPQNAKLGVEQLSASDFRLVLDLHDKEYVYIFGDHSNWRYDSENAMLKDPATGYFWIELEGLSTGSWFSYQLLTEDGLEFANPLSELILDKQLDGELQQYWDTPLPPYPPYATGIVSTTKVGGFQYAWQNDDEPLPSGTDLVIYELLVRDFLEQHNYQTLIDTLTYLQKLGINAIELMPVSEFEGNISWGYNPSFHTAVDKAYGSPEDLKAFIDTAHGLGIAVILDVVYNHVFSQSPLAQLYWDPVNFRPSPDNPWLNVEARHPFNVGYDVDHSSPNTMAWLDACNRYWIEEFHVDGFRFDLSKGYTQTQTGDVGSWNAYDQSRIDILERMAEEIWSYAPETHIILEHLGDNDEELVLSGMGMMPWGNLNGDYTNLVVGIQANPEWGLATARGYDSLNLVTYFESHDEERLTFTALQEGLSEGDYDVRELGTAIQRLAGAYAFLLAQPGPKMLWQFGELGYDKSINTCPDGTINNGCRTDPKPILWEYFLQAIRQPVFNAIRDVNALRKEYPETFRLTDFEYEMEDEVKFVSLGGPELSCVLAWNTTLAPVNGSILFPEEGTWYDYHSGSTTIIGPSLQKNEILPAGQFRVWLNLDLVPPSISDPLTTGIDFEYGSDADIRIYPNPAGHHVTIEGERLEFLEVYNLHGRLLFASKLDANTDRHPIVLPEIPTGVCLILIKNKKNGVLARKLVVEP